MSKNLPRHGSPRTFALPLRWRGFTLTVLALGGGGTTVLLIQEEALTLESLGPVAAIPLLGAPILWLVRTLFNQAAPQSEQRSPSDKGHS